MCIIFVYLNINVCAIFDDGNFVIIISIINHTLQSTIRAVISTLTCTSMVSNSTSDSECYLAVRVHDNVIVRVLTTALIVRGLKCVIN